MRQIAILALIILAASAATADMKINCSTLAAPAYNFYKPPMDCVTNDTAISNCTNFYAECTAAAGSCTTGMGACLVAELRCFEVAAPTATQCSNWVTMFNNEKLYITAGGDYSGSSLELSCRHAVCAYEAAHPDQGCSFDHQKNICNDALIPSTIPPAGRPVVVFTIGGDKAKFSEWLSKDKSKAFQVLQRMIAKILGTSVDNIVIIDAKVGSLVVDFYTVDNSLDVTAVQTKLQAAKENPNAATEYFTELATEAGVDASTLSIASFNVVEATPTPAPGSTPTPVVDTPAPSDAPSGSTPAPLAPGSASAVATTLAVVAAVAALLF
eukprot:408617_1